MSGFLPDDGRAQVLNALVAGDTYLGIARGWPTTDKPSLANLDEMDEGGYARVAVEWNEAVITDTDVYVANSNTTTIGPPTEDMLPARYAFLTDVQTGTALEAPVVTTPLADPVLGAPGLNEGTYFWVVTAVNAKGETVASNEVSNELTAGQSQDLSWGAVTGAESYNVYRGTSTGNQTVLVGNTTGTTITDDGSSSDPGSPPSVNSASVGKVLYIWEMAEPLSARALKPIQVPAGSLKIR